MPLSESSELKRKSSICIRVKQICTNPTTSSLHEVAHLMESLHGLINIIQRQRSPELRTFAVNEVNITGYTDEDSMLQAMITLEKLESYGWSQLRCRRYVDHDKFQLRDDKETCIHDELGRQDRICS